MTVSRPTLEEARAYASTFHMTIGDTELKEYLALMEPSLQAYDLVESMPEEIPEISYPRGPVVPPNAGENSLNAWFVKAEVKGAAAGPLQGKTVVLKDNVCLAGVPMLNGTRSLEGYSPDIDATVVTRILDAGGTIVGKAHCEYFCASGGSHTNATGPVHNPHREGYMAGGSSSGSAALVAKGEVDMAIGGDQGGSIRIPSSYCGTVGMKPTHGLVPYTGIMPIESTIDHVGPITSTVFDNALLLEVLAGEDGLDPRQYAPRVERYTAGLDRGIEGMKIGIVKEGFGLDSSEQDVDAKVRAAAAVLKNAGAGVDEISIPMHPAGFAIWFPIAIEGAINTIFHGNGFGTSWKGRYTTSLLDHQAKWRETADSIPPNLKLLMLIGEHMLKKHHGLFHAKAQNLNRQLIRAYDGAFTAYDALIMPTTPMKAQPIPPADAPKALYIQRAFENLINTAAFDATGHPALSLPCGMSDGLPVGMMLIGKHFDEAGLYRIGRAFERAVNWRLL